MRCLLILTILLNLTSASWISAIVPVDENIRQFTFQSFYYEGIALDRNEDGEALNLIALPKYYYQKNGEFVRLALARDNLALRQPFRGSGPFIVYRETVGGDGEIVMAPVASLPESSTPGGGHLIIFLSPKENGLMMRAVSAGADKVGPGTLLLLNLTPRRLAAHMGDGEPELVLPGQSRVYPYKTGDDYQFHLRVATEENNGWRLIRSTNITQVEQHPLFMIVHPDARRDGQWQTRFLRLSQ